MHAFPFPHNRGFAIVIFNGRFHVQIGMKSAEQNDCMGLCFKDYRDRMPSDAKMIDDAVLKLHAYFRKLQWKLKPKTERAKLSGQSALVLEFQGDDADQVAMNGECYMMAYRGFGYWFFTWAPRVALREGTAKDAVGMDGSAGAPHFCWNSAEVGKSSRAKRRDPWNESEIPGGLCQGCVVARIDH